MKLNLHLDLIKLNFEENSLATSRTQNPQVSMKSIISKDLLESCLNTLDIFRDLLDGYPQMKNRVVRDVHRAIQIQKLQQRDIIYDLYQKSTSVFFCFKGSVSISILEENTHRKDHEPQQSQQPKEPNYLEIDSIESGQGFGEAQFIAESKRVVRASARQDQTIIGKLEIDSIHEVIENYKMRVYYKKRDMFNKCPLFKDLSQQKIQFIINNTKVMTIGMSKMLVQENDPINTLYLINKGKVKTWKRVNKQLEGSPYKNSEKLYKYKINHTQQSKCSVMGGLLDEGSFVGDMQIALKSDFPYNVSAITEKVQLYYCDKRIVLSQMTDQQLERAGFHYLSRKEHFSNKIKKFSQISCKIKEQSDIDCHVPLTLQQTKLKRKILQRYFEKKPSLIGSSSPRDISRMINRKKARIQGELNKQKFPVLQLFPNHSMKKRQHENRSFSPIAIVDISHKRIKTLPDEISSLNPEEENEDLNQAKSMMIKIKNSKPINLSKVRSYKQTNMAAVGEILKSSNKKKVGGTFEHMIQAIRAKRY